MGSTWSDNRPQRQRTAEGTQPPVNLNPSSRLSETTKATMAYGLAAGALAIGSFALGWMTGVDHANDQLPTCQEDEYLYPSDYEGPGANNTTEYECHNFDEVEPAPLPQPTLYTEETN